MRSDRWLFGVYAGIACVLICSCARPKQTGADFSPVVDSVGKVVTGLLVQQDFARAKEVIDSADAAGWLSPYNAEMMRLRVLEREDANMPEVQQRYEKLLEQDLTPGQQAEVLEKLTYISRWRRNDENTLKYGMQYMDACRQTGNGVKQWSTQAEMGSVMVRLGRTEEGLAMIDEALQALDGVKQFAYMDACILAMKSYIRTLNDLNRYEEVIPVGERLVAKLQDFAAHPEVYDDGSVRMPNDARRPGYVDFYTGQAYAFIAYAYASMGQKDEARRYSRLFDATKYSTTYNGRKQYGTLPIVLGGYSLGGLFSLWAASQTDILTAVAAMSPSLWIANWAEYSAAHPVRTQYVYLSLGDREEFTRNRAVAQVGNNVRAEYARLTEQLGTGRCTLEWNPGNHFADGAIRTAKGFAWCLSKLKNNPVSNEI